MIKVYIYDILKAIGQGAIISTAFGTYQQYSNNKIMQLNTEKQELHHRYYNDKLEMQSQKINELNIRINKLERKE